MLEKRVSGRRLSPEEAKLWRQVSGTVRAYRAPDLLETAPLPSTVSDKRRIAAIAHPLPAAKRLGHKPQQANTLDGNWDRRLARGLVQVDRTIDLHGFGLAHAHARLDQALTQSIAAGCRVILLITGRPQRDNPRMPPVGRGVIRASVGDWIAASGHAGSIAAIRNAHPRHGGAGALYIILRKTL
jgi:DNA-nicking Smr family endonuclease